MEIQLRSTKREVYRIHVQTFSRVSRKRENPAAHPEFKTIQSDDATIQRKRMFVYSFLSFQENLLFPSYSGFYANLTKTTDKSKAHFHVTLPAPPKKGYGIWRNSIMQAGCWFKINAFCSTYRRSTSLCSHRRSKTWKPSSFWKDFPVLSGFHRACAFLPAIYKRFKGSRLEDIAIYAGILGVGSAGAALKDKHYKRGMRIHKLTYEALLRQMVDQLKELNPPDYSIISKLKDLEGNSSNTASFQEKFNNIFNDNNAHQYIQSCFETIRNMNSLMANFWLSYMEMIRILLLH